MIARPLSKEDVRPAARIAQAARLVIGLGFEPVAEPLPEGDRLAAGWSAIKTVARDAVREDYDREVGTATPIPSSSRSWFGWP